MSIENINHNDQKLRVLEQGFSTFFPRTLSYLEDLNKLLRVLLSITRLVTALLIKVKLALSLYIKIKELLSSSLFIPLPIQGA